MNNMLLKNILNELKQKNIDKKNNNESSTQSSFLTEEKINKIESIKEILTEKAFTLSSLRNQ